MIIFIKKIVYLTRLTLLTVSHVSFRKLTCTGVKSTDIKKPLSKLSGFLRTSFIMTNYAGAPTKASRIPAATAEPKTPATLGPIACINKKL